MDQFESTGTFKSADKLYLVMCYVSLCKRLAIRVIKTFASLLCYFNCLISSLLPNSFLKDFRSQMEATQRS